MTNNGNDQFSLFLAFLQDAAKDFFFTWNLFFHKKKKNLFPVK